MEMKDVFVPSLLVLALLCKYSSITEGAPQLKRQGMFGLCQGWGAGCAIDYSARGNPEKKPLPLLQTINREPNYPQPMVPNYLFTSGSSWNPIGKRSAYFTNIPYLGNPFVSMPRFRLPSPNHLSNRYPLAYQSTFETRSNKHNILDE